MAAETEAPVKIRIERTSEDGGACHYLETTHESVRAGLTELSGLPDEAIEMMLTGGSDA